MSRPRTLETEKALALFGRRFSLQQIADRLECSKSGIRSALIKLGVEMRTPGAYPKKDGAK